MTRSPETMTQGHKARGPVRGQERNPLIVLGLLGCAQVAARGMTCDVALTLLEEAVVLLEEGRTAEVKALAGELARVFEENGVHREALAALRLFHEAGEREEATAETTRGKAPPGH